MEVAAQGHYGKYANLHQLENGSYDYCTYQPVIRSGAATEYVLGYGQHISLIEV